MRKVYLKLQIDATILIDEGVDIQEAINEAELSMVDELNRFDTEYMCITGVDVVDSK